MSSSPNSKANTSAVVNVNRFSISFAPESGIASTPNGSYAVTMDPNSVKMCGTPNNPDAPPIQLLLSSAVARSLDDCMFAAAKHGGASRAHDSGGL